MRRALADPGSHRDRPRHHTSEPVDYPDIAAAVARAVASGQADRGVLVCGSGVGASVAANKIRGIRAGLCHDTYSAHQGVEHDDMNVLVLGGRVIGEALAAELALAFAGARVQWRGAARAAARQAGETRRRASLIAPGADVTSGMMSRVRLGRGTMDKMRRLWVEP